ncbi:Bacterial pre-peptidase C-terminal domain OS=Chthonomonas calidirosea (strain DSM 23976 / ICMP 18418 / T49) GN=CCALI_02507 PE=4 SV=1: PPC [Gemmataceae bacterium]|nr:Bacterial pre-peptidase C-terminal domain OS=Chthonomonas calidirosea (strain DSM 23976 / ICMP 18418 / T49) GN=CCALI_02507 PE=4 SV=1: PPC [Gemmataceae bacterium]VTT96714.1 Bacterial pre-peptidase C-terminal domain OS=Chthonomonas calidirosea (strain DSM 23976 / ICMP 18418 / T49) GN=CCALI_02507 PE=4 SV=1: PPC [Gemmataceae bacterium]
MRSALALLCVTLLPAAAFGQTSFPMLTYTSPVAVQRGTSTEVAVACQTSSLHGAYKVLFEGAGLTAAPLPPKDPPKIDPKTPVPVVASVTLKVDVAADARLGVHEFRIATAHGISSLGQLLVVDLSVVKKLPGIGVPEKAQAVPVPCVVCGRIEAAESVDYYTITAKAGQLLTFEVSCARTQDKIHDLQKHADPLVAVYDATGKELAAADDGFFADPVLTFAVPQDGAYRVAVRDAKYDGDPRWAYALTVTDTPYAAQAFPIGVGLNQTAKAAPVGSAAKLGAGWTVTAPAVPGITTVPLKSGDASTNPVPVVATALPLFEETEPNDTPKAATRVTLPCGVNARIGAKRDLDHFVFAAVKGKPVRIEVFARRFGTELRSQLDSAIDVMTPDGKVLASNDDLNGKDAGLVFTPAADGDVVVRVRDLNNKGGDAFPYYLEIDAARPDFTIKCDPSKAMIGAGSRTAWYAQVTRTNGFAGPVKVEVKGLPAGVTVSPLTIPANMTQGLLVVSAAADAKPDAAVVTVVGTAAIPEPGGAPRAVSHEAVAVEEIYLPGGGRGRFDAGMQAVAVTTPSDIAAVKVSKTRIVLKPGEEVKIDVEVLRGPGYDKAVTLDVPLRHLGSVFGNPLPPGVTMLDGKSKTLLGTGSAGHVVLKAAPDAAECDDVPVCVQAFVAINFVVKIGYASEVIWVSVKK